MRWPFGRRSTPADGATTPSAAAGRPAAERPHDAWRSLPAVQRLVGDPPVVAPAAPFAAALATRQPAGLALAPLGHEISKLATPGLVLGVATAAGAAGAAAISGRIDLPLQRRVDAAAPTEAAWSSFEPAPESASEHGSPPPAEGPTPATAVTIQRLAAPAPLLTTAATAGVNAAPAGRLDLRPIAIAPESPTSSQPPVLPIVQREAPVRRQRTEPGEAASPSAPVPARRPTLGEARRLGLGAPLRSPADVRIQRSEAGAPNGWQPGLPLLPRDVAGATKPVAVAGLEAASTGEHSLGVPAVAAAGEWPAEPHEPPALELTVVQPLSIERLPSFPRLHVQRSIATPPGELSSASAVAARPDEIVGPAESGRPEDPPPFVVSRSVSNVAGEPFATVDGGASADSPSPTSPVGGSPIRATSSGWLLRQPAPGPSVPGRASTPTQPSSSGPVVSRAVGNGPLDTGASGHPMAAQLAALGITIHREPAGPLAQRTMATPEPPAERRSSDHGGATVVPLQRAVEIPELQVTGSDAGSQAGSAAGSTSGSTSALPDAAGTASPAASPADRERELDELARRLYGRIRSRLASELLADRERAGLLVDLR